MADDFNPYQAPDAPVVDDFIAVGPVPRPRINFVVAAISFGCATFVLFGEILLILMTIDIWSRAGTRFENHPTHLGGREFILVPIGCSGLAFLLAGRSFWGRRDRRGVFSFLLAIGLFASAFLIPWLFP